MTKTNQNLTKPYSPFLEKFLIDYFKLKPNRYTQNDYLFTRQGKDYDVGYNPRCQLLDITPVGKRWFEEFLPYHATRITKEVQKLWEEVSFEFMLQYGQNIDEFLVARLYGLRCQSPDFPYITYLTKNDNEWAEVENWAALAPKYMKRKIFQYAYFGEIQPQKLKVPAKIKKQQEKKTFEDRVRYPRIMPEHIVNLIKSQENQ
jgi:hypothetical protein